MTIKGNESNEEAGPTSHLKNIYHIKHDANIAYSDPLYSNTILNSDTERGSFGK